MTITPTPSAIIRQLSLSERIARTAHAGQVDKAGVDYVRHLQRVAFSQTGYAVAVGWLHDVLEDTDTTRLDLLQMAVDDEIVNAVVALTHRPNEARHDYYVRVKANRLALPVKIADVRDNADPRRLVKLDGETQLRLIRKYADALESLETL